MIRPTIAALLSCMICARIVCAAEDTDAAAVRNFERRVSAYLQLRKSVESSLPPLKTTSSPERISAQEHELAHAVREARKSAMPGDIFIPEISVDIRHVISSAMQLPGNRIEASLHHAEPVQLRLRVNDGYPADVPLQSTPPSLLTNLPPLPKEIEYRVTGHDLILLDAKANLVIDLIENVIP